MSKPYNGFRALRPDYLAQCDGNACAALLLDLFAYWTQVRSDNDRQAQSGGKEGNDLWFYRSLTDLHDDLYGAFGRAAIRTALKVLHDKGLVESRCNPLKPWDRTLQYRTLHGAKSDDAHGSISDDVARARPSRPTDAQVTEERDNQQETARERADVVPTDQATALFDYWREHCEHPQARPTAERTSKIKARLKDGYTPQQIRTAIDGAARAAFVSPDNGKRFDDVELICRTGAKLEDFISRASLPANGGGNVHQLQPRTVSELRYLDKREQEQRGIEALERVMAAHRNEPNPTDIEGEATEL
jgi:hypothetical protein